MSLHYNLSPTVKIRDLVMPAQNVIDLYRVFLYSLVHCAGVIAIYQCDFRFDLFFSLFCQLFFTFSFVLDLQYFFVLVLVLPTTKEYQTC